MSGRKEAAAAAGGRGGRRRQANDFKSTLTRHFHTTFTHTHTHTSSYIAFNSLTQRVQ